VRAGSIIMALTACGFTPGCVAAGDATFDLDAPIDGASRNTAGIDIVTP
jgi:hypothetical protein